MRVIGSSSRCGIAREDRRRVRGSDAERRFDFPDGFEPARAAAYLDGFSLHAGVRVHENDREGLARLCRYALRPTLALKRLSLGEDGRLVYRMKRPRGGSLWLVLCRATG